MTYPSALMINRRDVEVWVRQGRECLQNRRASPSYVESCLIGLRGLTRDPEAKKVHADLQAHLEEMKIRWKSRH